MHWINFERLQLRGFERPNKRLASSGVNFDQNLLHLSGIGQARILWTYQIKDKYKGKYKDKYKYKGKYKVKYKDKPKDKYKIKYKTKYKDQDQN